MGTESQGSSPDILISLSVRILPVFSQSQLQASGSAYLLTTMSLFSTKPALSLPLKPCSKLCSWWSSDQILTKLPVSPQSLVTLTAQGCPPMGDYCFFCALVSLQLS